MCHTTNLENKALLSHELPDVAMGCHASVVDDRLFASAGVPNNV